MSKFVVRETVMKPRDTIEKFEKKVKKATLDPKKVAKFIDELNCKEGYWGIERCEEIRAYLEDREE